MALYAPPSNLVHVRPPSRERSEPEVPTAIHNLRSGTQATAERNPAGREGGSLQVRPPSDVTAILPRFSWSFA